MNALVPYAVSTACSPTLLSTLEIKGTGLESAIDALKNNPSNEEIYQILLRKLMFLQKNSSEARQHWNIIQRLLRPIDSPHANLLKLKINSLLQDFSFYKTSEINTFERQCKSFVERLEKFKLNYLSPPIDLIEEITSALKVSIKLIRGKTSKEDALNQQERICVLRTLRSLVVELNSSHLPPYKKAYLKEFITRIVKSKEAIGYSHKHHRVVLHKSIIDMIKDMAATESPEAAEEELLLQELNSAVNVKRDITTLLNRLDPNLLFPNSLIFTMEEREEIIQDLLSEQPRITRIPLSDHQMMTIIKQVKVRDESRCQEAIKAGQTDKPVNRGIRALAMLLQSVDRIEAEIPSSDLLELAQHPQLFVNAKTFPLSFRLFTGEPCSFFNPMLIMLLDMRKVDEATADRLFIIWLKSNERLIQVSNFGVETEFYYNLLLSNKLKDWSLSLILSNHILPFKVLQQEYSRSIIHHTLVINQPIGKECIVNFLNEGLPFVDLRLQLKDLSQEMRDKITHLNLDRFEFNMTSEEIQHLLATFPNIQRLCIGSTQLVNLPLNCRRNLIALKIFGNEELRFINGDDKARLIEPIEMPNLLHLHIGGLANPILPITAPALKTLYLYFYDQLTVLPHFENVQTLVIFNSRIKWPALKAIGIMPNLTHLRIEGKLALEKDKLPLEVMPKLQKLELIQTNIKDPCDLKIETVVKE